MIPAAEENAILRSFEGEESVLSLRIRYKLTLAFIRRKIISL